MQDVLCCNNLCLVGHTVCDSRCESRSQYQAENSQVAFSVLRVTSMHFGKTFEELSRRVAIGEWSVLWNRLAQEMTQRLPFVF